MSGWNQVVMICWTLSEVVLRKTSSGVTGDRVCWVVSWGCEVDKKLYEDPSLSEQLIVWIKLVFEKKMLATPPMASKQAGREAIVTLPRTRPRTSLERADNKFLMSVVLNDVHLHCLLPPMADTRYDLRERKHPFRIPENTVYSKGTFSFSFL